MTSERPSVVSDKNEEWWRNFLEQGGDSMQRMRWFFRQIPAEPRCFMCASPFNGPGAPVMRLIGKRQSTANPNWCTSCFDYMTKHRGGAEVEGAFLFADIRGSTALAERLSSSEYHALLERYFQTATSAVFKHDGFVDKFVGDELVALFYPLLTGERFAERAVDTAKELLTATGHGDPEGPWVPVGAGIHAGLAWFGSVGEGTHVEMTAVGDAVNVAARLAAAAEAGEILISADAATAAGVDPTLERHSLELKGKELPTEVVSIRVSPA